MDMKSGIKNFVAAGSLFALLGLCAQPVFSLSVGNEDLNAVCAKVQKAENKSAYIKNYTLSYGQSVLVKSLNNYALDVRYIETVKKICAKIEPQISRTVPSGRMTDIKVIDELPPRGPSGRYQENKLGAFNPSKAQVTVLCAAANQSFESFSGGRVVILDSLVLDTLYRCAQYRVYKGSYGNLFEQVLENYTASLGSGRNVRSFVTADRFSDYSFGLLTYPGQSVINPFVNFSSSYNNFNSTQNINWNARSFHAINAGGVKYANPAHIPIPKDFDEAVNDSRVQACFEELLAPLICHEISHCLLDHDCDTIEKYSSLKIKLEGIMNKQEAGKELRRFLSRNLKMRHEREADICAAKLGMKIGLRLQNFEDSLTVCEHAEYTNKISSYLSNSNYVERRRIIGRVYSGEDL